MEEIKNGKENIGRINRSVFQVRRRRKRRRSACRCRENEEEKLGRIESRRKRGRKRAIRIL
jgi:hypothetical protein